MEKLTSEVAVAFINASPYLAVFIVVIYLFKDTIKEWLKKPTVVQKPISMLQYHDMFTTANSVRSKVQTITFSTHGNPDKIKTKMLHKLIDLKIDCVTKNFKEFLREDRLEKCDGQQLKYEISAVLSSLVNEYNDQALEVYVEQFKISKEDSRYLIDCYETFRQDIVEGFLSRLESITTNDDYTTNYEKISAVLEVIAISLYIIPKDAKNAMDLANGRFMKYAKDEASIK